MTVAELYQKLNQQIPPSLSCAWDNDGLLCCPDADAEIHSALIALDVTDAVADQAVAKGYDLILSHHPLIFRPLRALEQRDPIARRVIKLLRAGVTVMSFHTRLDAVTGGVNDVLATSLGLQNIRPFGNEGEVAIGRVGELPQEMTVEDFALLVKRVTGADATALCKGNPNAHRVAVLGGSGSDEIRAAIAAGADTYVSGELKYNDMIEAPALGINLIAAGHFYTENLVCDRLKDLFLSATDGKCQADIVNSNPIVCVP